MAEKTLTVKEITTDVLIIGGGTAGCFAAYTLGREGNVRVLIAEKANLKRSGCLAAGVNALNAYIVPGWTPQDYVDYASRDAAGIVRGDLLETMSERLNQVTETLARLGLVILKDKNGEYVSRGNRNLKINGENIKPLLAAAALGQPQVTVINQLNITDLLVAGGRVCGALGFAVKADCAYVIRARAVLCATGGAAGLYRPNNPGFSRHKLWYPPFNTGAGYAMGLKAGAEMTTLEMRFIALRCQDTIAPTGTIAQGVHAGQINSRGEHYEARYGHTTAQRLYGTVMENLAGRGPCYLKTVGITPAQEQSLLKAYLNMAPAQTLKWLESGPGPSRQNVEIEGTEPYVVGGHTASGYWLDTARRTTVPGLYAAGDVAGGCPQKYVTGALVEGEIAAQTILADLAAACPAASDPAAAAQAAAAIRAKLTEYTSALNETTAVYTAAELEEAMQKVMDTYAGGIGSHYQFNTRQLALAAAEISRLQELAGSLAAADMHELLFIYELRERLLVCQALIAHLDARRETRWHSFAEHTDYPALDPTFERYVNSRLKDGHIVIHYQDLVKAGERYEH